MKDAELQEKLVKLESKIDKLQNLEERLEICFRNVEKFRDKMIDKGYSYNMIDDFNHAIQPIVQHYNEIRNARKKMAKLQEEQRIREKEASELLARRKSAFVEHMVSNPQSQFPYNHRCSNFSFTDGEAKCEVKMDLQYCSRNCPYATTEPCSNKVDYKGNVIPKKKR